MIRIERAEWATCPHCQTFVEQTFLLPADPRAGVRWSTCRQCGESAIWEGAVAVFPTLQQLTA